jgi:hypothetical protein
VFDDGEGEKKELQYIKWDPKMNRKRGGERFYTIKPKENAMRYM